mmetsp:Transcript_13416/g.57198  ORF Transcript_13416/g.57198 Transcript_13416/m.57198 type:complete len:458 (-) Transcript_13416:380-1753(-)
MNIKLKGDYRTTTRRSQVGDASLGRGGHELDVLVQRAAGGFEGRRLPRRLALLPLLVRDVERVDGSVLGVDLDDVAVLHQADGAADLRLGGDVSDDEPVRAAGEAAVGDQRALLAEAGAHDGGGGREHLGHARATLGTFVADHDHGALERVGVRGESIEHLLLGVVALRETLEVQTFLAGDFGDGALGGDVAEQALQVASLLDGLVEGEDDLLAFAQVGTRREVLGHGLAGARHAAPVDEAVFQEVLEHAGRASDLVHVLHDVLARGLEVRDEGDPVGDSLEVVQGERDAHGVRHGDQVQHGVGGPAERDDDHHGVLKRRAGHDVAGLEVDLQHVLDGLAGHEALVHLQRVLRGDGGGVGQGHAERLDGRGHGVGGVHAAARAGAGARLAHNLRALRLVDGAGHELAVRLERGDDVQRLAVAGHAGPDRAAVHHEAGAVQAPHRDDAAGHVLVAAGE